MTERLDPLAFPLWGSRLIEASAGTGKTWTIAALYLRLVLGHGDGETAFDRPLAPQEILVMTFTVAATRELSGRVRERLVEAARAFRGDDDPADPYLRALTDAFPCGPRRDAAAWRLATAAEAMDDAAVFTIDAWIQRMLREHAFDSGSLFDEELQPDDAALLDEAGRDYWRQQVYPLADAALDAVLAVWKDVEALAADMRVLARIEHDGFDGTLATCWSRADDDRRAAEARLKAGWIARVQSMREWIHAQLASKAKPFNGNRLQRGHSDKWLDRLHHWAATPGEPLPNLQKGAHRLTPDGLRDAANPGHDPVIPAEFAAFEAMLETAKTLPEPSHAIRRHAAAHVAERLRSIKQRAGTFGFDDLLQRLDRALAGPGGERLRARIVAQYPAALIDEFQDTSPLQYRIFDRLYRIAADGRDQALLLIGDPKQSIYGFRGADIRSYLRARVATGARRYLLTTNYRSTAGVVATVDRLFGHAEARAAGAFRFGTDDSPLPFVAVDAYGRTETLRDAGGPVAALTLCHDTLLSTRADAQRRFADHCAEHIVTALNDAAAGFTVGDGGFRRLRPADLTVMVRDRYEAASIRRALQKRGVPSVFLSHEDSVMTSREAADLLHWLRAVADPLDTRRARIGFATALIGLPLDELALLATDDRALEARLEDLRVLNAEWRRHGVLPMLRQTLHRLDLPARWLAAPDGERRLTNVLHLAELLQAASAGLDGEQALIRWLAGQLHDEGLRVDEQLVRLESDADLVTVVTIHKAKGLEYPVVYLPYVCGYRRPRWEERTVAVVTDDDGTRRAEFCIDAAVKARVELEQQQEDLRLLYVALTRAQHALWLGVAPLRDGFGEQCGFRHSAFGYLIGGEAAVPSDAIAGLLHATFDDVPSVRIVALDGDAARTRLVPSTTVAPLVAVPPYAAAFERDWTIGSFSAFVRDLTRVSPGAAMVTPAVEEELLTGPVEDEVAIASNAPRHRFPRGAPAGNFLHDQLEWLASQRFALNVDPQLREQLARRCERQGWGARASDVVAWMSEVLTTPLPPLSPPKGVALNALPRPLSEMEFWLPSDGLSARTLDAACRRHLLAGRERPPLPDRHLRGLLMGFADLVFEVDGRYWVLDYKSNALGAGDADYTADALEASMAAHRYDVQAAVYLLALHRLLRLRLGARYDPERQLGGALYLYLRGIRGPAAGCVVVRPPVALLDELDAALGP